MELYAGLDLHSRNTYIGIMDKTFNRVFKKNSRFRDVPKSANSLILAEREGFEPSEELSPLTRLAGERLQPTRPSLQLQLNGGGSRIRTHGAVTLNGFQDRRFRPLSHPSSQVKLLIIILRIAGQYFCYCWLT